MAWIANHEAGSKGRVGERGGVGVECGNSGVECGNSGVGG